MARDWASARYGYNWRGPKKAPQTKKQVEVTPYGESLEVYITSLREYAQSMSDATIEKETVYGSYGDSDHDEVYLNGWVDATPEQVAAAEAEHEKRNSLVKKSRQANVDAAEALLRKERPELFGDL